MHKPSPSLFWLVVLFCWQKWQNVVRLFSVNKLANTAQTTLSRSFRGLVNRRTTHGRAYCGLYISCSSKQLLAKVSSFVSLNTMKTGTILAISV